MSSVDRRHEAEDWVLPTRTVLVPPPTSGLQHGGSLGLPGLSYYSSVPAEWVYTTSRNDNCPIYYVNHGYSNCRVSYNCS